MENGAFLFNIVGPNDSASVHAGDDVEFTSSTLDITVSPGSATVNIEFPGSLTGPTDRLDLRVKPDQPGRPGQLDRPGRPGQLGLG